MPTVSVAQSVSKRPEDVEKEMAVAKTEEADAQEDYQKTVEDSDMSCCCSVFLCTVRCIAVFRKSGAFHSDAAKSWDQSPTCPGTGRRQEARGRPSIGHTEGRRKVGG